MWHALFILPVGAVFVGAVASSGVMLASWQLNLKPNIVIFYIVLTLGISANVLFYGLVYFRDLGTAGLTADQVSFVDYVSVYAANLHYRGTALAQYGALLMFIQFIGFVAGASWIFYRVASEDVCTECDGYLAKVTSHKVYFPDAARLNFYFNSLATPDFDVEALQHVTVAGGTKYRAGYHNYEWIRQVMKCKACQLLHWRDRALVREGVDWTETEEYYRVLAITESITPETLFNVDSDPEDREGESDAHYKANVGVGDYIENSII